MLIQCTKKLLDNLPVKIDTNSSEEASLFSWHANLITLNRRKTVVIMNDLTRYSMVLYGLKAKDFGNFEELVRKSIYETFLSEGIKEEIIKKYIEASTDVTFTKTKDRSSVARLNKACDETYFYSRFVNLDSVFLTQLGKKISRSLVGTGKNTYIWPNEELYRHLEEFAGQPIFSTKAVQVKITLDLDNHDIWRRVIVPLNLTFSDLHEVIQTTFGWQDYHLHDFLVFKNKLAKESKPIINLVCDDEAFAYPGPTEMKLETGIKLSEYLPENKTLLYTYDFGDNWQHLIEVEDYIENHDLNYPICLEGKGNTPPEDVGSEPGYDEFLEILANPDHTEHTTMVNWGRMQGYKEFNLEQVNRFLKSR